MRITTIQNHDSQDLIKKYYDMALTFLYRSHFEDAWPSTSNERLRQKLQQAVIVRLQLKRAAVQLSKIHESKVTKSPP